MRQQGGGQLGNFDAAAFGFKHQPHRRFFARLVAHPIQHRQHAGLELRLLLRQCFFASFGFGVGEFFNFFQHPLRTDTRRQFGDDQLPLPTGEVFHFPTRTHLETASPCAVGIGNVVGTADEMTATRIVRPGHQREQVLVAHLWVLEQSDAGIGHFAQVVAGDFGG